MCFCYASVLPIVFESPELLSIPAEHCKYNNVIVLSIVFETLELPSIAAERCTSSNVVNLCWQYDVVVPSYSRYWRCREHLQNIAAILIWLAVHHVWGTWATINSTIILQMLQSYLFASHITILLFFVMSCLRHWRYHQYLENIVNIIRLLSFSSCWRHWGYHRYLQNIVRKTRRMWFPSDLRHWRWHRNLRIISIITILLSCALYLRHWRCLQYM